MNCKPQKSKLARMLQTQQQKAWDMDSIDWDDHDFDRPLLPIGRGLRDRLQLTNLEHTAVSQLLGLVATRAIAEHESALQSVKRACWSQPTKRQGLSTDMINLGEQFFAEEAKHSSAFARYVGKFAATQQIPIAALDAVLPQYRDGLLCRLFRLNSWLRGRAMWWLVMLTEEESLDSYRRLRPHRDQVDPLFYRLHELHFQEEVRHISYAPMMLRALGGGWLSRLDYRIAEVLHMVWILSQLRRLKRIKGLTNTHPFFAALGRVYDKFFTLSWRQRWHVLFYETPFLSDLFRPTRHRAMRIELKRNGDYPSFIEKFFLKGYEPCK